MTPDRIDGNATGVVDDLLEGLKHAVSIIETHVPEDALGEGGGCPEEDRWPLRNEYLHYMRKAIERAECRGAPEQVERLKPCPFCGGKAELFQPQEPGNEGGWVVGCIRCQACSRVHFSAKEDARPHVIEAWNARAALSAIRPEGEAKPVERGTCDRAEIVVARHGHDLTDEQRDNLKRTIRLALDTEVEAGGPFLNNGWNARADAWLVLGAQAYRPFAYEEEAREYAGNWGKVVPLYRARASLHPEPAEKAGPDAGRVVEGRSRDGSLTVQEAVSGVLDLFPGADRQALQCLAELMAKPAAPEPPLPAEQTRDEEINRLRTALDKIDGIRNSIIGCQNVNWSEHIYPLVAALRAAGYEGESYKTARDNVGTLIERTNAAEARVTELEAALREKEGEIEQLDYEVRKLLKRGAHRDVEISDLTRQRDRLTEALRGLNEALDAYWRQGFPNDHMAAICDAQGACAAALAEGERP